MFPNSEIKKKKNRANLTCIYSGNTVFSKNALFKYFSQKTSYIRAREMHILVHYLTSLLCWFSLYSKIVSRNKTSEPKDVESMCRLCVIKMLDKMRKLSNHHYGLRNIPSNSILVLKNI